MWREYIWWSRLTLGSDDKTKRNIAPREEEDLILTIEKKKISIVWNVKTVKSYSCIKLEIYEGFKLILWGGGDLLIKQSWLDSPLIFSHPHKMPPKIKRKVMMIIVIRRYHNHYKIKILINLGPSENWLLLKTSNCLFSLIWARDLWL